MELSPKPQLRSPEPVAERASVNSAGGLQHQLRVSHVERDGVAGGALGA